MSKTDQTGPHLRDGQYGHRNWRVPELTNPDSNGYLCGRTKLMELIHSGAFGNSVRRVGNRLVIDGTAIDEFLKSQSITPDEAA
ncbi:hypothetical protein [Ruegeria lacuscaerulensis]|uniref:hypothetical protein n=1 Tax=Ruegeria lacuscaerulensis TaxID=55218 RepID=UPI00147F0393|nr:hypothetical protein [Ruegeria lacuscaerulensis]